MKTLREYIATLNNLAVGQPEALDCPVVYSRDDEGNSFKEVVFDPTFGKWEVEGEEIKAVCLN